MPEAPVFSAAPDPAPITPMASPPVELQLQAEAALETPPTGQLLLGTDKRNPVFAVYEDDAGERLLVFYGFELIEIVKNDSADPAFKLLLARLYNAKVKLSALSESFGVDPKTIRRWGKALLQGDPAELVRVLEGRKACHKLTAAVKNFARWRWPDLVAERSYGAVGRLRLESSSDTPEYKELRRQVMALKTAELRYEATRLERRKSIEQGHKEMAALQVQIAGTQAQESRLEAMIQADMVRMEGQCKRLMDVLRITVRNLFYQALQPFKKAYDNYRDDHDYFRKLTQSPGVMEVRAQEIVIHLMPRTNYGGELRKAVIQALEGMNALGLGHPCLPGRKLKFRLGQRSEMELKMNVED